MRAYKEIALCLILICPSLFAQATWQEEFAKMPLPQGVTELHRSNCVRVLLGSFQRNSAVKALIVMPGATDEFYFFRRAHARVTNAAPTLLDAIIALTNQTYIRVDLRPPFLLLHGVEDPLEPVVVVEDAKTADKIKRHQYTKHAIYDDTDWDHIAPTLAFHANAYMFPKLNSGSSFHFFRNSYAEYDLTAWEALEATAMASKTMFTVQKRRVTFDGDKRPMPLPVPPDPKLIFGR